MLTDNAFFLFLGPFAASYLTTMLSNQKFVCRRNFTTNVAIGKKIKILTIISKIFMAKTQINIL